MLLTESPAANRVLQKELLIQTVDGDVVTVRVDRDETLASFKKRLQSLLAFPLEKTHLEFGSLKIPLGESALGAGAFGGIDDQPSPQLRASGRLNDFPNGVPVLLKQDSLAASPGGSHRRSLSSPNLSLSFDTESFLSNLRSSCEYSDDDEAYDLCQKAGQQEYDPISANAYHHSLRRKSCPLMNGGVEPSEAAANGNGNGFYDGDNGAAAGSPPSFGSESPESLSPCSSGGVSSAATPTAASGGASGGASRVKPSLKFVGNYGDRKMLKRIYREIHRGFRGGSTPERMREGLGGCYVFKNAEGKKIAVAKPTDEEPLAPNNPKGFVGRQLGDPGLKPTVRVGEAGIREAAAYLLDHGHFAKVPCTSLARMTHECFHYNNTYRAAAAAGFHHHQRTKLVSVQEFVEGEAASDLGTTRFPPSDVHRIGILDIRLFNTDRHSGNILVKEAKEGGCSGVGVGNGGAGNGFPNASKSLHAAFSSPMGYCGSPYGGSRGGGLSQQLATAGVVGAQQQSLVPIDHGFCLPETLEAVYFEWLHWPQASMPFTDEELDYIADLDPKADVAMLRRELPMLREESLRILQIGTILLKKCAAKGLTLCEIGEIMSGGFDDEPSELELICKKVMAETMEETLAASSMEAALAGRSEVPGRRRNLFPAEEEDEDGPPSPGDGEGVMFDMDDIDFPAGSVSPVLRRSRSNSTVNNLGPHSEASSPGAGFSRAQQFFTGEGDFGGASGDKCRLGDLATHQWPVFLRLLREEIDTVLESWTQPKPRACLSKSLY
eukprot:CAMPEP_0197493872 /NCGR_PEP_ID=MMETSP1311-20131121/25190_1 /TAXON_ID=464262 /ORGANISM="Genus nov. species nov., Strain RCC856" /LENGTH=777 /DNA_ID=CAMNT_0043039177 /DNA_START=418 /DNA_END=2751 /DNA_ORIENTATION=-